MKSPCFAALLTVASLIAGCVTNSRSTARDSRPTWVRTARLTGTESFAAAHPPQEFLLLVGSSTNELPAAADEGAKTQALQGAAAVLLASAALDGDGSAAQADLTMALQPCRGALVVLDTYVPSNGVGVAHAFALERKAALDAVTESAKKTQTELAECDSQLADPARYSEVPQSIERGLAACTRLDRWSKLAASMGNPEVPASGAEFRRKAEEAAMRAGDVLEEKGSELALHDAVKLYEACSRSLSSPVFGQRIRGVKVRLPCATCVRDGRCSSCAGTKGAVIACSQCRGTLRYQIACTTCRGDGKQACAPCNARGEIAQMCTRCQGGTVTCSSCDGKGRKGGEECYGCSGRGTNRCMCGGSGSVGGQTCLVCGGSGQQNCYSCMGRGRAIELPCFGCSGSGRDDCNYCDGDGQAEADCSMCSGSGRSGPCGACRGLARQTEACRSCNQGQTWKDCTKCGGDGKCPQC